MKLLIDADFIVYKACAAAETEIDWGDDVILVTSKFSDAYNATVREISKLKGQFLWDVPSVILFFSDAMGIYATKHPDNMICSPDKDMRQIPGRLFNMEESTLISDSEGAKWHLIQSMAGDQTDGYSGIPGVGVKRAQTIFESKGYSWKTVVESFEEKGMTEDDALVNARLARILTAEDYDFENKQPIPWTPTADYKIDNGAGSKVKVAA